MAEELWTLLKLYTYEIRYHLYGTWKNESFFLYPILISTRADCLDRAKYIMNTEEFVKRLPPIDVLLSTYHIPHSAAFFLSKLLYAHAINRVNPSLYISLQVKYDELKKLKDKKNHKTICYINAYKEVMGPVVEAIKPVFSSKIWDDLTPQFYITFWSLSMYDLYVPKGAYEKQIFCRKIKSVQWKLTKTCLSARNVKSKKDARS
nr:THO complex subunit 2-like [Biomphalaria glabrata]